jgi:hypothetical protein
MLTTAKVALTVSWTILTVIVCTLVVGLEARGTFIVLITGLHLIGYQLYKHQGAGGYCSSVVIAPVYQPAMQSAAIQQLVVGLLSLFMLDGGFMARTVLISAAAYWVSVGIIAVRRPTAPTGIDTLWVRYGFLLLFVMILGPFYAWATFRRP